MPMYYQLLRNKLEKMLPWIEKPLLDILYYELQGSGKLENLKNLDNEYLKTLYLALEEYTSC
ncbi:MAG: hypothetical protein DSM107014_08215 [Gomphosphaeria aponina SAG 52.96 = DSM 107014]|uniref:Uncharacterized protein n=1 Tax=Gomphosphaeria aponina SAG 52.96 = DSM 107014 TaxID=1521640 RepID=A0A941GQ87_9CHRO|nr:hypothetical protein [Gomphosphaeria aponina SAG 52.96 = DSM 107014]